MSPDRGFLSCRTSWREHRWLFFFLFVLSESFLFLCVSSQINTDKVSLHMTKSLGIWLRQSEAYFSLEALGGPINSLNQLRMQQPRSCKNGHGPTLEVHSSHHPSIDQKKVLKEVSDEFISTQCYSADRARAALFHALIPTLSLPLFSRVALLLSQ